MRANSPKKTALLVTNDFAVETAVRNVVEGLGHHVKHLKANQDAMCAISDACARENFVIVDLDEKSGRRSFLNTAAGILSVIVISAGERPWLKSMLRHRCIGAILAKPVSAAALVNAIDAILECEVVEAPARQRRRSVLAGAESKLETDFHRCLRFALCRLPQRRFCAGVCRGRCAPA